MPVRKQGGECLYHVEEAMTKVISAHLRWRKNYNTVTLLGLPLGLAGGWTSPFLAKLTRPDSELFVTNDEASWIASLVPLGRVLGAIIGSVEVAFLGSKFSLLCTGIPMAMSWICLMFAKSVVWIYVARLSHGLCMGMLFSTFPLYVGEVSHPKIRGAIIGLIMNSTAIGFIVGCLMGSLMNMWLFSLVSLVPTIGFLVLFALVPASPHYLISRKNFDDAAKALVWYQRDVDVKREMESIRNFVSSSNALTTIDTLKQLNMPKNRKALIMALLIFVLLQFGGTYAVGYYMEIMLRRAGVISAIEPSLAVVVIGVFGISGGFLAMYVNDKFGRKIVLGGSSFGLTISLGMLGVQYVLLEHGYGSPSLEWFPIVMMTVTEFFVNLGIGPVPSTIVSEIFSPHTKSIAACLCNIVSGLFAFVNTKTYQTMIDTMPDQYVMWSYAIVMGILGVYTFMVLPETKGKSLKEIQDMLANR